MAKARKRWKVIGRGFNGWHATGCGVSSSGGDLEPRDWWAGGKTKGYLEEAYAGCLVYDASKADADSFIRLVMNGPIVNPLLKPSAVRRFSELDNLNTMLPGLGGGFKSIAQANIAGANFEGYSSLDYVGVGVFERLLRKVPGVRIGKVRKGKVVWEDEAKQTAEKPAE